eukprot:NODE_42_length_29671_cov_0.584810.p22 type:complete len:108 gc:universal NODE_42_length_29671_cov_0.584810:22131-21808(-)
MHIFRVSIVRFAIHDYVCKVFTEAGPNPWSLSLFACKMFLLLKSMLIISRLFTKDLSPIYTHILHTVLAPMVLDWFAVPVQSSVLDIMIRRQDFVSETSYSVITGPI